MAVRRHQSAHRQYRKHVKHGGDAGDVQTRQSKQADTTGHHHSGGCATPGARRGGAVVSGAHGVSFEKVLRVRAWLSSAVSRDVFRYDLDARETCGMKKDSLCPATFGKDTHPSARLRRNAVRPRSLSQRPLRARESSTKKGLFLERPFRHFRCGVRERLLTPC